MEDKIDQKDFVENKQNTTVPQPFISDDKQDEGVNKRQKLFKDICSILFIVFIISVIAITAYNDFFGENAGREQATFEEILQILGKNWWCLLIAVFFLFVSFFWKGLKNVVMCKALTGKGYFKLSIETAILGTYYNNVTPLAVGGQPFEIYHLSKHGVRGGAAASIPIASFFLNQLTFVILAVIALTMFNLNVLNAQAMIPESYAPTLSLLTIIGCICFIAMPSMIVLFSIMPKIGSKLVFWVVKLGAKLRILKDPNKTLRSTIKTIVHNSHCLKKLGSTPVAFLLIVLLSFLENFCLSLIPFFVLKTFGFAIEGLTFFQEYIVIAIIAYMLLASVSFVPTPGNSGVVDGGFYLLFSGSLVSGLAFPAMMTWRLCSFYGTLIVGFILTTHIKNRDAKKLKLNQSIIEAEGEFNEDVEIPDYITIPNIETPKPIRKKAE